jgi:hypothetical protein
MVTGGLTAGVVSQSRRFNGRDGGTLSRNDEEIMPVIVRFALSAAIVVLAGSVALADGIEPGLWRITSHTEAGGMISPSRESSKCITAEQAGDVATTFSPVSQTINSTCAPIDRSFDGQNLNWHLVCKGQLDMELTGAFVFDSAKHYLGTVHSKAVMMGQTMLDQTESLEGQWVSACQ